MVADAGELVDASGAWRVRPVRVERGGRLVERLRVEHHGFLVADCVTVEEVGRHVDLASLRPPGEDQRRG